MRRNKKLLIYSSRLCSSREASSSVVNADARVFAGKQCFMPREQAMFMNAPLQCNSNAHILIL